MDTIRMILDTLLSWPDRILPLGIMTVLISCLVIGLLLYPVRRRFVFFVDRHVIVSGLLMFCLWCAYAIILAMAVVWTVYLYTTHLGLSHAEHILYSSHAALVCSLFGVLSAGGLVFITALYACVVSRTGNDEGNNGRGTQEFVDTVTGASWRRRGRRGILGSARS